MTPESLPVVVVVGAAGGIGLEILKQIRADTRTIAIVLDAQQAGIAEQNGAWACLQCDIGDAASVETVLAQLSELLAPTGLDAVIHTAALQPLGVVELIRREDLEKLFAVNLFGTLQLAQGLIPFLRRRGGRIVLFSSMAGRVASPLLGAYSASKHALEGIADTLRRELLPAGIGVSLVEPGGVSTPMAAAQSSLVERGESALSEAQRRVYGRLYRGYGAMAAKALRHASRPEDVARAAVRAALGPGRSRPRHVVGTDARLMILLSRWLPVRWFDRLLVKAVLAGGDRPKP